MLKHFERLCMLWSVGKDSTVLLWPARKAFGHVLFPLVHIDTSWRIPEMITYRDKLALEYQLTMVVGQNVDALKAKTTFPDTQHLPEGDPRRRFRTPSTAAGMLKREGTDAHLERNLAAPTTQSQVGQV